jgi:endonuclease/exonuclease/phosphatase (EEP) superfamily protein YafD
VLAILNSFPAWLFLPAPVMSVLATITRRRATWIAALVPVVLWLVMFGWRFLPKVPRAEGGDGALRVMAFNVLGTNEDMDGMAAAISAAEPDLIALSELAPAMDAALAGRLGAVYPYRTLHLLEGASFGTGIYSRWPLDDLGSLQTGLGLRSAAADVHTPDGTVRFVALHPRATVVTGRSGREIAANLQVIFRGREAQLAAVCRYLDEWGDRPVILAGDFNLTEFSDAYRCVAERLSDAYHAAGYGYGYTWPNRTPAPWPWNRLGRLPLLTRIDYAFHSRHWVATDARVLEMDTGSDHSPVIVALQQTDIRRR